MNVAVMLCATTTRPRLWILFLAWPAWVCFALLTTGNHFWLDIAAGIVLGALALLTAGAKRLRFRGKPDSPGRLAWDDGVVDNAIPGSLS